VTTSPRKPEWLKVRLTTTPDFAKVDEVLDHCGLNTVCREARCPNRTECWSSGTATFLIMGNDCTRGCAFCAVARNPSPAPLDPDEPQQVAKAAARLGLAHVVITSVTRDDLPDRGAGHFATTVMELTNLETRTTVEVLTPDYLGAELATVLEARPAVFAHNIEVVERLSDRLRHKRFSFKRSLKTLSEAKRLAPQVQVKSSILLGVGEALDEVVATMKALLDCGLSTLVLGQYLRPTKECAPVVRYVEPQEFDNLALIGRELGFAFVSAGPLVRTSYRAAEACAVNGQGQSVG
jgi:lipoic acid synthetase